MPKELIEVPAKAFLEHPERYGFAGTWIGIPAKMRTVRRN